MPTSQYTGSAGSTPVNGATASTSSTAARTPDLGADAGKVVEEARSVADTITAEAQTQASTLVDQARTQVAEVTEKVKGYAGEQKDYVAGQIGGVADALDRVAADLEQTDAASARYARVIADNTEKLSRMVRDKDVDQLMAIAQDFGRRQPVVFVGAALLLGFAASRFLSASAERRQPSQPRDTYTDATGDDGEPPAEYGTSTGTGATNGTYTPGGL